MSVDDEAGYTSEDASSSSAPSLPPAESLSLEDLSIVSASTQTMRFSSAGTAGVDVGVQFAPEVVDQGVQCLAPVLRLMVSSASQCEDLARMSTSAGVQCGTPAPAPPVSRGTQCCSDASRGASIGVQCRLLVEEVAAEKTPSAPSSTNSTCAGIGSDSNVANNSKNVCEEVCDSSDTTQSVPDAADLDVSSAVACVDERGTTSKNKKKRKKAKASAVAARAATSEDAVGFSSKESAKTISVRLGGWIAWVMKGMMFWGVAVVLATVWGARGRAGEASVHGGGLLTIRGVHNGHEERAQPPVWVKVGGSFTLGDVLASRRSAANEGGAYGVQWFKGGHALPGQNR